MMVYLGPTSNGIRIEEIEFDLQTKTATLELDIYCDAVHISVLIPISECDYDKVIAAKDAALEAAAIYGKAQN